MFPLVMISVLTISVGYHEQLLFSFQSLRLRSLKKKKAKRIEDLVDKREEIIGLLNS